MEQLKIQAIAARIEGLDNRRRALLTERSTAERQVLQAITVEGQDLAQIAAFQVYVRNEELSIAQARRQCENELTAQREKLVDAQRQVKLLQNLREKRITCWTAELAREEEQFAAEAFLARWQPPCADPAKIDT